MKKNDDLEIIKRIERSINKELKQLSLDEIRLFGKNGYCLAAEGRVVGLNLDKNEGFDLSLLQGLSHLSVLIIISSSLSDVSPLASLNALTFLEISKNRIKHLPKWVCDFSRDIKWEIWGYGSPGLYLEDNPLETPPIEVVKEGKAP